MVDRGTVERIEEVDYEFVCNDGPFAEFRVYRFRLSEEINAGYDLYLDLVTDDVEVETDDLLGASCTVGFGRGNHKRYVSGVIEAVDYIGRGDDQVLVNVRVVPAFYLLRQQTHSRIFQDRSVQDILALVLGPELAQYGRTLDAGSKARGTAVRDYCVQYRESDMDFCIRLMEEEGISFYFVHADEDPEVLTLVYESTDLSDVSNVDETPVVPIIVRNNADADVESLRNLDFLQSLVPTTFVRRDYNFETPLEPLEAEVSSDSPAKQYVRRVYRHGDRRHMADDVVDRAEDDLQAMTQGGKVARGTANAIQFCAGFVFEVERHVRTDLETRFILTRVVHTGECPDVLSANRGHAGASRYQNTFQCVPAEVSIRPKQRQSKPRCLGPETGIVSGPSGEEIHVDEQGRIKVQFHWEQETTYDDTSSAWIRVRQSWSGPGWGFQFIPRIGQEVIVEFLGGDIERPIVTGTVYNGDNPYPYAMPDNKTQSGIKTDSVSGDGSNELRFEDMSGSEEVYIHCQKDFTIATENDKNQTTGHDETLTITNDRTKEVGNDQKETVKNDKTITVEGKHDETIIKDMKLVVQGNRSSTIVKNCDTTITGKHSCTIAETSKLTISLDAEESVGAAKKVNVAKDYEEVVGAVRSVKAKGALKLVTDATADVQSTKAMALKSKDTFTAACDKDQTLSAGGKLSAKSGKDMSIKSDKKIVLEAGTEFSIKVGSAKLVMKSNGDVTINGVKINIKGSGPVTVKGSKTDVN